MENECSPATGKLKSIKVFFGDKFAEDHFEARDYRGNPFPIKEVSADNEASIVTITLDYKAYIRKLATERKTKGLLNRLKGKARRHHRYKRFPVPADRIFMDRICAIYDIPNILIER